MGTNYTKFRIENDTPLGIKTSVSGIDPFDFYVEKGPKEQLQSLTIQAKSSVEKEIALYKPATNCPITMELKYTDGSIDKFRINLQWVHDRIGADFVGLREDHIITYRKDAEQHRIIINIKYTPEQLDEQRSNYLKTEAESLIEREKYEEAINKLLESRTHLYDVKKQIEDRISHCREKILEKKVEQKIQLLLSEIDSLIRQEKYEEALKNITGVELISKQSSRVAEYKAKIKNLQGEQRLQMADEAQNAEQIDEANRYMQDARDLFEEANRISPNWDYSRNLRQVENRLEGNDLYNLATELDEEADKLRENQQDKEALEKFSLALDMLNEAETLFNECGEMGQEAINFVKSLKDEIKQKHFELAIARCSFNSTVQREDIDYHENYESLVEYTM